MSAELTPTEDRKALARRLLLERAVVDELAARLQITDKEARDRYSSGDADVVEEEDDMDFIDLGKVSRDRATMVAEVEQGEDFDAFVQTNHPEHWETSSFEQASPEGLNYLREHHPELVETIVDYERVAPAYVKAVEAKVAKAKGGWDELYIDPDTGEATVRRPHWLHFRKKAGAFRVVPSPEMRRMVRDRFGDGRLSQIFLEGPGPELVQISPGPGPDELIPDHSDAVPTGGFGPDYCPVMWARKTGGTHYCGHLAGIAHSRHVCTCDDVFVTLEVSP